VSVRLPNLEGQETWTSPSDFLGSQLNKHGWNYTKHTEPLHRQRTSDNSYFKMLILSISIYDIFRKKPHLFHQYIATFILECRLLLIMAHVWWTLVTFNTVHHKNVQYCKHIAIFGHYRIKIEILISIQHYTAPQNEW